jgi:hypothetical protein
MLIYPSLSNRSRRAEFRRGRFDERDGRLGGGDPNS